MALIWQNNLLLVLLSLFCMAMVVSSHDRHYTTPNVTRLTDYFSHVSVNQAFSNFFGGKNIQVISNGSMARLALDKSSGHKSSHIRFLLLKISRWNLIFWANFSTGSGFLSKNKYYYGFFSAAIKLPAGFSSGVVVAFYVKKASWSFNIPLIWSVGFM